MSTVFLIHWNAAELPAYVNAIEDAGYQVVGSEAQDGARAVRAIRDLGPDAVVVYLERSPSHGRETAAALQKSAGTRGIPVIFVGGSGHGLAKARLQVPSALFVEPQGLLSVIQQTLALPS